jgi:hypothetical protein
MAAIVHDDIGTPHTSAEQARAEWLGAAVIVWLLVGPAFGMVYGYHIHARDWLEIANLPLPQQSDIEAMYYASASIDYILGAFAWGIGLMVLGLFALRAHVSAEDNSAG